MPTTLDIIDFVNPANNVIGVPLNNAIQIIFDREIDEWSIEHGGLIVEGPDSDQVIYPGYVPTTLIPGSEQEILQSPGLMGIVPGKFTFQRIALATTDIVNTPDTTGAGNLYRTKAIFKPDQPLKPQTNYSVYLVGDDDPTDEEMLGLRTRTVFDPVIGANTGTGSVTFSGTYLGNLTQDTINIRITQSGVSGEAEFEAWRTSQPLDLVGPYRTSTSECQVLDGITIQFVEGLFQVDDEFSVVVKRPQVTTGTAIFTFSTGNGSITVVPTTTATSVTGDPAPLIPSTQFKVLKTTPIDGGTNLPPAGNRRLTIEFSDEIDPTSVTTDRVQVIVEPVIDHPLLINQIQAGPISHVVTVSGTKMFIDL
jgi:hypothetical protein